MAKKSIRIAYYALANNPALYAGQFKYFITSVWGDELKIYDDTYDGKPWFSLWANGECVLADELASLHAVKGICAEQEYEYIKDIR